MINIFVLRGIGEPLRANMLMGGLPGNAKGVVGHLPPDRYRIEEIPWAAQYGPVPRLDGLAYGRALDEGMSLIERHLEMVPPGDTVWLLGYSGGATLAGNFARYVRDLRSIRMITGVVLVADPMRPIGGGDGITDPAPGFGIGGQREIPDDNFHVIWITDPADVISAAEEHSPVRTVADQTYALSFRPGAFPAWLADLGDRVAKGRWQAVRVEWWNPISVLRQYARAARDVYGYLWGGDHTGYAVRLYPDPDPQPWTYLEAAANEILYRIHDDEEMAGHA